MPVDMKESIAEAVHTLLMDQHVKKLTVKDIVNECQITRQAFYYHFEDIPALFRWVLEKKKEQIVQTALEQESPEKGLRYFLLMAINATPYVKKAMQSNYRDELDHLLTEYVYLLFEQIVEREGLYQTLTRAELKFVLRYHSQAVLSIIRMVGCMHEPGQVSVRIQTILHCCLDQAEHHRTAGSSLWCIGEQEVLPVNNEGLDASLCSVVAQLQSAVLQVIGQVWPLLLEIVQCLTQSRLGRGSSRICPRKHRV